MANLKGGPGRRSKGDRKAFMTRLPNDVAAVVEAEAGSRGLSYSEYLALITAQAHGIEATIPPRLKPIPEQTSLEIEEMTKSA